MYGEVLSCVKLMWLGNVILLELIKLILVEFFVLY